MSKSAEPRITPLYVGAQNDALFIIDQPPRPVGDYENPDRGVQVIAKLYNLPDKQQDAFAQLFSASAELYRACQMLEDAERAQANCPECTDALSFGELCEACSPAFDQARIARRAALAKARGDRD